MNYSKRKFDNNGLYLAKYQAELFERSIDSFDCSSKYFVRKFKNSKLLEELDKNESALIDPSINFGIESLKEYFLKDSNYGNQKYTSNEMFWIGYIYRYISYTRRVNTRVILKYFPLEDLRNCYYIYHTLSEEQVIQRLLETHNLTEDIFDPNKRLKMIMIERKYCQGNN